MKPDAAQDRSVPRIPLFPADIVAFPGEHVPFHVGDERALALIADTLEDNAVFGLTLAQDDPTDRARIEVDREIGTLVEIIACEPTSDGELDVVAVAHGRFRVKRRHEHGAYDEADVEMITEVVGDEERALNAEREVRRELVRVGARDIIAARVDLIEISYRVASALVAPNDVKQIILAARTAADRLEIERLLLRFAQGAADAEVFGVPRESEWGNVLN